MMEVRFMRARSVDCRCTHHFTCGHCLKIAADRNAADRNAAPIYSGDGRTLSRRESRDVARHIAAHEPFTLKIGAL
jgi:hypothetical protein